MNTIARGVGLAVFAAVAIFSWGAGCGDAHVEAIGGGTFDDGGFVSANDSGNSVDASGFCQGSGPLVPIAGGARCTEDLGRKLFRFAVCACTTGAVSGRLHTDSFYSPRGPAGAGAAASLAANGSWLTNSHASIGGSVYTAGTGVNPALSLKGDGTIAGDVHAGGAVASSGTFQIGGDLYAAGDVTLTTGTLATVGKVHVSPGHTATGVTAAGGVVTEPVSVIPPCDCAAPLDIPAIVAPFATDNDDARAQVTARSLDRSAQPLGRVELPCGRYYFDTIAGGDVTLALSGRTAIFVGGSVGVGGAFDVELAPGAELDLFVAGDVSITGSATFGSPAAPAKVRLYSGGAAFALSGNARLGANVYAPHADLSVSSNFEMSGALNAKSVAFSGDLTIHYDESVVDLVGCQPPGGACSTCNDCAGATPACKNGTCAPCVTNADCCAPLSCANGACVISLH